MNNSEKLAIARTLEAQAAILRQDAGEKITNQLLDTLETFGVDPKVFVATWLFMNPKGTQQDVANMLGITTRTIKRWRKDGFDLRKYLEQEAHNMP